MAKTTGLGRGLSALMGEGGKRNSTAGGAASTSVKAEDRNLLPLEMLSPGNFQPRRLFTEENLHNLVESIVKNGVILPVIVRPAEKAGHYEIIAGERRWRASKIAGLTSIPVIIRELTDKEALEFALIENIQRQDLTPLEEADGYQRLINEFSYTQENLATRLGKSRSHIANLLRLLGLPPSVKELLHAGGLSMGHARALVNVEGAETLAVKIIEEGLSVRQTEKLVQNKATPKARKAASKEKNSAPVLQQNGPIASHQNEDIAHIAEGLSRNLGMPVSIAEQHNSGTVTIHFNGLVQLDTLLQLLSGRI